MKTHLNKIALLILSLAATAGTASAQRLFVRGDAGIVAAGKSPYDQAGAAGSISVGSTLDAASQHELSLSLGVLAWAEPEVRGHRPDDARGTTTLRIDGDYFDLPTSTEHFTVDGDFLKLSNGTNIAADYRPALAIVPIMANYRLYLGQTDARVRFFLGAGAGYARLRMESELWKEFKRSTYARTQSDTATSFTWSATAGISVKIIDRLRLDFSYAYQSIEGADFRMPNLTCNLDRLETHLARGGVTWVF
ncbi:MAG: outer membrane beta-barrel protein [Nibricoccus sp.]